MPKIWQLTKSLFSSSNEKQLKSYKVLINKINSFEAEFEKLSDEELKAKTAIFKQKLSQGASLDDILCESYAVVKEAAKRVLKMRPFDVQLLGGIVLHQNSIAQMRTGEGKTLTSTMPIYLNALEGKGVHVVTVNDYLAKRDAEHMGKIYSFLGLTTGVITNASSNEERRQAYNCDITYATNNELGFDYLRDNMVFDIDQMVQRGHHYAIIDEVDSILIDEARTPLIISGPLEDKSELYNLIDNFIPKLTNQDYEIDEKQRSAIFTEIGNQKIEKLLKEAGYLTIGSLYDSENTILVHHVNNALRAHKLFTRDKDYMVQNNEIIIIDEFTGRMMPGRRYSEGLHQALEAKEHVAIQPESQTLASITFQNYFRMYKKLAGMTGTASTEAEEFSNIYNLNVVEIPTNLPIKRIDDHDEIYCTQKEKYSAIINEIKKAHAKNQPILVGTTSIEKSEFLAKLLRDNKIKKFQVLNAKYHEQEAYIIAQAGVPGNITIATNMAGRGTDIQLGGNLEMRIKQELSDIPPGPEYEKKLQAIKQDIEKLKAEALEAGGLYVLATERHESRRIDNQLRGRSGRQGDPGRSKFFLSLEDDLMRIFGSEKMQFMLQKLGIQQDEAITHPWISKALEKAQVKVEARNFEMRKNLLKYDDVMNDQRKVIFDQRLDAIKADNIDDIIREMTEDTIYYLLESHSISNNFSENWQISALQEILRKDFNLNLDIINYVKQNNCSANELAQYLKQKITEKIENQKQEYPTDSREFFQRAIIIQTLDQLWHNHIMNLDHLRSAVGLRGFAQRDPLNEYKTESFVFFQNLLARFRYDVIAKLLNFDITEKIQPQIDLSQIKAVHPAIEPQEDNKTKITEDSERIGRNQLCPCGSQKKYKHCHGRF